MIKITKLTIKNFLSIGNVTQAVDLSSDGVTLILGMNNDANNGVTKNGAGKSSLLQAVCYALYGKPLTKIKIPNLVNNINAKAMLVTLDFEKGDKRYRIERGQKPAVMRFFVDDKELKTQEDAARGENRHTQDEIERIIGMNLTMFKHLVALTTFTEPFLRMSSGDQRTMIEELLGITQISQRAETLKALMSDTKERVRDLEAHVKAATNANERIEATIAQALDRSEKWVAVRDQRLRDLKAERDAVSAIDFDKEIEAFDAIDAFRTKADEFSRIIETNERERARVASEIKTLLTEATRYERQASEIDAQDQVARLRTEIARKEKEASRHDEKAQSLRAELVDVLSDIENADAQDCVCCGQPLKGTDHLESVVANLLKQKSDLEARITKEEADARERRSEIALIEDEMTRVASQTRDKIAEFASWASQKRQDAQDREKALAAHQDAMDAASEALRALGEPPETMFASREEVYAAKSLFDTLTRDIEQEEAKQDPYAPQVEDLRETLQVIDLEPLEDARTLLKHQEFLYKLLTGKDSFIRKKIIEQNIAYLNTRLNHYLDKLGLPHEVRFLSDLSVEITLLGRDFDFEQLSRGEMNRVIMATSWSFRDVWESLNESINLFFLDEILDQGTDTHGAEAALAVLKSMAQDRKKNVFLISHRDELVGRIDRTLHVCKENSFTRIEID